MCVVFECVCVSMCLHECEVRWKCVHMIVHVCLNVMLGARMYGVRVCVCVRGTCVDGKNKDGDEVRPCMCACVHVWMHACMR